VEEFPTHLAEVGAARHLAGPGLQLDLVNFLTFSVLGFHTKLRYGC